MILKINESVQSNVYITYSYNKRKKDLREFFYIFSKKIVQAKGKKDLTDFFCTYLKKELYWLVRRKSKLN